MSNLNLPLFQFKTITPCPINTLEGHSNSPWSLLNTKLHLFRITAAKAALELHIPHQSIHAGENEIQQNTSPRWLIDAFQESPALPMSCCVVPPTDRAMVEVVHEKMKALMRTTGLAAKD